MTRTIDSPEFCRLELWDGEQWVVSHAGISLLHPMRYVERLAAHGKTGRVTVLDDRMQPREVLQLGEPEPGEVDRILARLRPNKICPLCDEKHPEPFDGKCLL